MRAQRLSVAIRVMTPLVVITTVLSALFGWTRHRAESDRQMAELRRALEVEADQAASALSLPVWNIDLPQIDRNLESLMRNPALYGVMLVRDKDIGEPFHGRVRGERWEVKKADVKFSSAGMLIADRDISLSGRHLGLLRLAATTRFLEENRRRMLWSTVVSVLVLDLLLIVLLCGTFWRNVLRPLRRIQAYALSVAEGGSGERELPREVFSGELESLHRSIEKMVALLQRRFDEARQQAFSLEREMAERQQAQEGLALYQKELEKLNASLETKVGKRTAALERSNARLAEALGVAESATRTKSEFLANMSHEIRTPMNAVMGMLRLAQMESDPERLQNYVHKAFIAADSLLGIISDILDFSKIEAKRMELEERDFLLQEVLDRVCLMAGAQAEAKGVAFRVEVGEEVPRQLVGDPLRLGQILTNLCLNAVKFTDRGGVSVQVRRDPEEDVPGRLKLWFSVTDTGIGIAAQEQARLFEPFCQGDSSITRRYGGTGLGLAISKELVGLMQGKIGVCSEPGIGSMFSFSACFGLKVGAKLIGDAAVSGDLAGIRVLLVEDNAFNRQVATGLLSSAGVEVLVSCNGEEAIAAVAGHEFDAVLMDIRMPVLDGLEATRRIRAQGLDKLPIIAMTAHATADDRSCCLMAGMNDFLTKPVDPERLYATLARWVKPQRPEGVAPSFPPNSLPQGEGQLF